MLRYFIFALLFLTFSIITAFMYVKSDLQIKTVDQASSQSTGNAGFNQINKLYRILTQSHNFYRETIRSMGPSINPGSKLSTQNSIFKYALNRMRVFYSDNGDLTQAKCETVRLRQVPLNNYQFQVLAEGCVAGAGTEFLNYTEKPNGEIEIEFYPGSFKSVQGVQMTTLNKMIRCQYMVDAEIRIQRFSCAGLGAKISSDLHFELVQFTYSKDQQNMLQAEVHVFKDLQDLIKKVSMKVPFEGKINIIEEEIPIPDYSAKPTVPTVLTTTTTQPVRRDDGPSEEDLRHEAELREAAKFDGQESNEDQSGEELNLTGTTLPNRD
jgi:hypothetical protein